MEPPQLSSGSLSPHALTYEALNFEPCPWDRLLTRVYVVADQRFYALWSEKGYMTRMNIRVSS